MEEAKKGKARKEATKETAKRVAIGVTVDEKLWKGLRSVAVREGKLTGELLDRSIEAFLKKQG